MPSTFFFYDLETSGISAARDRIMQFGGQRTDIDLKAVGQPINVSVRLSADILPSPQAVLVSGISVLENQQIGISEAQFSQLFNKDIALAGTIFTGFNNIRFDDEFIRYSNYRNFYDAYGWHWQDAASRWDMLDVVRMTRALRPQGINWPFSDEGKPTNKLELLTAANKLAHTNAHDALSDALATLEVAKLIKSRQPKLFSYLLGNRKKQTLIDLIKKNDRLVYSSSHYSSDVLHTTIVYVLSFDQRMGTALVFDLREDVRKFLDLPVEELTSLWEYNPDLPRPMLPLKTMKLNRCPAVAPLSVLDSGSIKRLKLDMDAVELNYQLISKHAQQFSRKLKEVTKNLDARRDERRNAEPRIPAVDERLYDKFIPKTDANKFTTAREKAKLSQDFEMSFEDKRLTSLYALYRARNYPDSLSKQELSSWREFVKAKAIEGEPSKYQLLIDELNTLKTEQLGHKAKLKLLKDLETYAQTIVSDYGID